jgi:thymidylate synthase
MFKIPLGKRALEGLYRVLPSTRKDAKTQWEALLKMAAAIDAWNEKELERYNRLVLAHNSQKDAIVKLVESLENGYLKDYQRAQFFSDGLEEIYGHQVHKLDAKLDSLDQRLTRLAEDVADRREDTARLLTAVTELRDAMLEPPAN